MPYSISNPPKKIKRLGKKAQRIWIKTYNSAIKQYKGDEGKAHATAWSAVKKAGYKTKQSKMEGETTASSLDPSGATINKTFAGKKKKKKKSKSSKKICKGGIKMKKMSKFKKWSNKIRNALPDSAFAATYEAGDKEVRKLPFKDANGKVDVPHLRNALVRVAQRKTNLSPAMRVKAFSGLKEAANKYLKTHKTKEGFATKSAEIMSNAISKFEADTADKLDAIIKTLKSLATNKKPDEEVSLVVKQVGLLIDDLEEIVELERVKKEPEKKEKETEEKEDKEEGEEEEEKEDEAEEEEKPKKKKKKKKKKEKEEEEEKEDKEETEEEETEEEEEPSKSKEKEDKSKKKEKKEDTEEETEEKEEDEDEEDEDEEESKFQEALKVAEGYKQELSKNQKTLSKFKKKIDELETNNKKLTQQISKFKKDNYSKVLNGTVEKISKFRKLNSEEKLSLKKEYLESKMSESALEEIGRVTDEKMFSKLGESKPTTKPTEQLTPAKDEKDFSKMSKEEKLDALANVNAKQKGFVTE